MLDFLNADWLSFVYRLSSTTISVSTILLLLGIVYIAQRFVRGVRGMVAGAVGMVENCLPSGLGSYALAGTLFVAGGSLIGLGGHYTSRETPDQNIYRHHLDKNPENVKLALDTIDRNYHQHSVDQPPLVPGGMLIGAGAALLIFGVVLGARAIYTDRE